MQQYLVRKLRQDQLIPSLETNEPLIAYRNEI